MSGKPAGQLRPPFWYERSILPLGTFLRSGHLAIDTHSVVSHAGPVERPSAYSSSESEV